MATVVDTETGEVTENDDDEGTVPSDEPVTELGNEPEPEPEPEPETPPLSEKEIEQVFKKLEKEATQHSNRIGVILGEEAQDLVVCALCSEYTPGFYFPVDLTDDVRAATLQAIGAAGEGHFEADPEAQECDLCRGYGETLTGSKVQSQLTKPCPKCAANGWTTQAQRQTWDSTQGAQRAVQEITQDTEHVPAPDHSMPAFDAWQRPLGHEFYGRQPVYMTPDERARDVIA